MKQVIYKPAEQRVMVFPQEEKETKLSSGIILMKGSGEGKPGMGLVVASGTGDEKNKMLYHPGDLVMYSQYSGLDVKLNLVDHGDHTYKVMNQLDIMGTIIEI